MVKKADVVVMLLPDGFQGGSTRRRWGRTCARGRT